MAKIKTLLKINGQDFTGQILTPFKIGRNKLWADDTGRLLSGDMAGTLIGIFPKITVEFVPRSEEEMSQLLNVLDTAWQSISYYSPKTRSLVDLGTYTNDYEVTVINLEPYYDKIKASFIARSKE